jgi:hypothetical protein
MTKRPESGRWRTLAALALAVAMVLVLFVVVSRAQDASSIDPAKLDANSGDLVYQCPMDHDIRSNKPGFCSRCGMKLKAGIPEPQEFPTDLSVTPRPLKAGAMAQLLFSIRDPDNGRPIEHFEIVHEKLFHMFVISQDMEFFLHDHPYFGADGKFRHDIKFPRTGMYRILSDFYPEGATPQLIARTVIVPGPAQAAALLSRDATKATENLSVSLVTDPPQPIAGTKTMLVFRFDPSDGVEKLLGAWGHMLERATTSSILSTHTRLSPTAARRCSSTSISRARKRIEFGFSSSAGA